MKKKKIMKRQIIFTVAIALITMGGLGVANAGGLTNTMFTESEIDYLSQDSQRVSSAPVKSTRNNEKAGTLFNTMFTESEIDYLLQGSQRVSSAPVKSIVNSIDTDPFKAVYSTSK